MEIKDRIKIIMDKENMPSSTFAESIGVAQATLSHILNGRNNPSLDVIMKIHQRYPSVNLEWILYGIGNMVSEESRSHKGDIYPSLFDQNLKNPTERPADSENRKEMALETTENVPKDTVIQEVKYIERPPRKITEIRIFFDDNTYETFKGEK